ncbi:MAG: PilZ domain-containing protein [Myxococcota bacterium]
MGKDKRGFDRHEVRFKLVYDDGDSFNAGLVHDLSESGVFLETLTLLAVDTQVRLSSLDIDEAHAFEVDARVTRVVEESAADPAVVPGMGLVFVDVDEHQQGRLRALISRLESEKEEFEGDSDPFFGKQIPREGLRRAASGVWRAPASDDFDDDEPTLTDVPKDS